MLQMPLALPDVACSPYACDTRRLGERAFDSAARETRHGTRASVGAPVPLGASRAVLAGSVATCSAPRLGIRAARAEWTHLAGQLRAADVHDGLPVGIVAVMPGDALLAVRTRHDLVVPVDVELRDIEGARGAGCPHPAVLRAASTTPRRQQGCNSAPRFLSQFASSDQLALLVPSPLQTRRV
jgi:hypothetical protein